MSSMPENSNKVAFSTLNESIAGNERRSGRNKKLSPWYVEHVKEEMKKTKGKKNPDMQDFSGTNSESNYTSNENNYYLPFSDPSEQGRIFHVAFIINEKKPIKKKVINTSISNSGKITLRTNNSNKMLKPTSHHSHNSNKSESKLFEIILKAAKKVKDDPDHPSSLKENPKEVTKHIKKEIPSHNIKRGYKKSGKLYLENNANSTKFEYDYIENKEPIFTLNKFKHSKLINLENQEETQDFLLSEQKNKIDNEEKLKEKIFEKIQNLKENFSFLKNKSLIWI